ncbi:hypothetical protein [Acholeplasma palmae]|nr:hypothetical protein [Alteracholeplasma palmae]
MNLLVFIVFSSTLTTISILLGNPVNKDYFYIMGLIVCVITISLVALLLVNMFKNRGINNGKK